MIAMLYDGKHVEWRSDMLEVIKRSEDSVVHLDLGQVEVAVPIGVIGTSRRLPSRGPTIVWDLRALGR